MLGPEAAATTPVVEFEPKPNEVKLAFLVLRPAPAAVLGARQSPTRSDCEARRSEEVRRPCGGLVPKSSALSALEERRLFLKPHGEADLTGLGEVSSFLETHKLARSVFIFLRSSKFHFRVDSPRKRLLSLGGVGQHLRQIQLESSKQGLTLGIDQCVIKRARH